MYKNKIACTLLTPIALALLSAPVSAAIILYDEDGTTFSADGYVNAFYVQTDTDN
ncbi:MAG TPA: porin, partial [Pseudomonas sp.]|nr:porin [Pseudomonas sp.]